MPFAQNRFTVQTGMVFITNPSYANCGALLADLIKKRLSPSQVKAISHLLIEEFAWDAVWKNTLPQLTNLKTLDLYLYGRVEPGDVREVQNQLSNDAKRNALYQQQGHLRSAHVSADLNHPMWTTLSPSAQSATLLQLRDPLESKYLGLAKQTDNERDEEFAAQKKEQQDQRSAARRTRGLRPL